ncbi:conserved protein of unknown function [Pseudomonas marincola]|uniref:Uncharacterized protein n=1 Tax=Pseudomonas marincola TaxID=437900 RepID=A0A653E211_9PSED|nr:conserved protein of unknown function [Pseudomonas marincola]
MRGGSCLFLSGGTYFAFIHMLVSAIPELASGRLQQPNTAFVDEHAGYLSGRCHRSIRAFAGQCPAATDRRFLCHQPRPRRRRPLR